jgi:hypothetical protein
MKGYSPDEAPENPRPPKGGSGTMRIYRPPGEFEEVLFGRGHRDVHDQGGYVHIEEDYDREGTNDDIFDLFAKWVFPKIGESYRVRISVREGAILVERING